METKKLKIFFSAFLISFYLCWGINVFNENLETLFFLKIVENNPDFLIAQVSQYPILNTEDKVEILLESEDLEINSESAISVFINNNRSKVLFSKNISKKLPIASLTKLMTSLIGLEIYEPEQELMISSEAIKQPEKKGKLKSGESLSVENLLNIILIESSNDAAYALAQGKMFGYKEYIGKDGFVELMNLEAWNIGLQNTNFANPIGLDDLDNYSTSEDLIKLVQHIMEKHPLIFDISLKKSFNILNIDGSTHHFIEKNTNKFLYSDIEESLAIRIIGGKTGWTPEAQGCLMLIFKVRENDGYLINIILGAEDRFKEMEKMINLVNKKI